LINHLLHPSAQAEKRKDRQDDDDQTDEINETVHCCLLRRSRDKRKTVVIVPRSAVRLSFLAEPSKVKTQKPSRPASRESPTPSDREAAHRAV
jgi:hypothetical protein